MLPLTAFSRVEYIDAIPFTANAQATLPSSGGVLPNDRFMNGLILEFRGRLTMPAANGPTALRADGRGAILERVSVEGYHKGRKQQEKIIDLRGADLELLMDFYQPGPFISTPAAGAWTFAGNGTNDIICQVVVPFTPLRLSSAIQAAYLLDAPNYESLKLTVQWGDETSIVVPGAAAPAWTAFGSAAGAPTLRVYGQFAMQANRFSGFVPGRIFRSFQEINGSPMTTTANQTRIWDIPKGFDIRGFLLKSGVKATDATAGINTFLTHTDFLTEIRVNVGLNKYVRRYLDGNAVFADICQSYNVGARGAGQNLIDFVQYGNQNEILNTRPLIAGPNGNVDLYLSADVAGAANQAAVAILEEWRYRPAMV